MDKLTHFNESGMPRMVDVSAKEDTSRTATACAQVYLKPETVALIQGGGIKKGDVLAVAQVAGIMSAKKTGELIPMCHNIFLSGCDIKFTVNYNSIDIAATVKCSGKTGVEMEALTACSVAALTIYDMCKAVDKDMVVSNIRLMHKAGGKSGEYIREDKGEQL